MNLKELIAKGTIEVGDDITFNTHAEVMRLFGSDSKVVQRSFLRHPVEPNVWISFWIFYQDDTNDWENTWGLNEDIAFERRKFKNDEYLAEMAASPDRHIRLLFAKIAPFGKVFYKFKGVYVFDPELSAKAKKCAYRRTSKTAKLYSI
jgi:hypothetical protein